MDVKYKLRRDAMISKLEELGYSYNIAEGAWLSSNGLVVVQELKTPYQRIATCSNRPDPDNMFAKELQRLLDSEALKPRIELGKLNDVWVLEAKFEYGGRECIVAFSRSGFRFCYVSLNDGERQDVLCSNSPTVEELDDLFEPKYKKYLSFNYDRPCYGADLKSMEKYGLENPYLKHSPGLPVISLNVSIQETKQLVYSLNLRNNVYISKYAFMDNLRREYQISREDAEKAIEQVGCNVDDIIAYIRYSDWIENSLYGNAELNLVGEEASVTAQIITNKNKEIERLNDAACPTDEAKECEPILTRVLDSSGLCCHPTKVDVLCSECKKKMCSKKELVLNTVNYCRNCGARILKDKKWRFK